MTKLKLVQQQLLRGEGEDSGKDCNEHINTVEFASKPGAEICRIAR